MKRSTKLAVVTLLALTLAGCLQASLSIKITPNPITFEFGEVSKEVTFSFTTSGFGQLKLDKLVLELLDEEGESVWNDEIELDASAFVVPGITHTEKHAVELPEELRTATQEEYDAELKGKTYTLSVAVTGGKSATAKVDVVFE